MKKRANDTNYILLISIQSRLIDYMLVGLLLFPKLQNFVWGSAMRNRDIFEKGTAENAKTIA